MTMIITGALCGAILDSDQFSAGDKAVVKWILNRHGSFFTALFDAIKTADPINKQKLALGFPNEVEGFLNWSEGDLNTRIDEFAQYLADGENRGLE